MTPARIRSYGISTRSVTKTVLLAFLLSIVLSIAAFAQDSANPSSQNHRAKGVRLTSILGTVRADGEKFGHFIRVKAHVYSDKGWIHITEVKLPTAIESKINDER